MKTLKGLIKISLKNIRRHPVKNILIGIVIFIASILFFFNGALNDFAENAWHTYFSKTFTGNYHLTSSKGLDRDYTLPAFTLPEKTIPDQVVQYLDQKKITYSKRLKLGGVVFNEAKSEFEGTLPTIIGMDFEKELPLLNNLYIKEGSYEASVQNGILVWKEYANSLKWKVGQDVTLYLKDTDKNAYPYTFKIMGILDHVEGAALDGKGVVILFPCIYISYSYLSKILSVDNGKATDIAIWDETLEHKNDIINLAKKYDLQFFDGPKGYGIVWGLVEMLNFFGGSLAFFILVILVVATINLNMLGFFERQKEIGAMVAIGAKPSWIVALLITEMIVFATIAFLIALFVYCLLILGSVTGMDFGEMNAFFAGKIFYLDLVPGTIISSYITIVLTMLISAAYPIYLTTKINPIEVFREAEI